MPGLPDIQRARHVTRCQTPVPRIRIKGGAAACEDLGWLCRVVARGLRASVFPGLLDHGTVLTIPLRLKQRFVRPLDQICAPVSLGQSCPAK